MPQGKEASAVERLRRWARSRRVVVRDQSMVPTLLPGDRLRVDTAAYRLRAPRAGELVVVVDPEREDRWLVKRVAAVRSATDPPPPTTWVTTLSDAPGPTRDSRSFGEVDLAHVVGRVYFRYAPPERRAEL